MSFFSKERRLVKKTFYLPATSSLAIVRASGSEPWDQSPYEDEIGGDRFSASGAVQATGWVPVSGNFRNASIYNPAIFEIDVPDYGKIRDIKVWVELIHDVRGALTGGTGPAVAGPYNYDGFSGLENITLALRSPNVPFKYAHPLWDDPQTEVIDRFAEAPLDLRTLILTAGDTYTSATKTWVIASGAFTGVEAGKNLIVIDVDDVYAGTFVIQSVTDAMTIVTVTGPAVDSADLEADVDLITVDGGRIGQLASIPEIFRNTYLLWEGVQCDQGLHLISSGSSGSVPDQYASWGTDMDMRTIFCDAASIPNPWHIDRLPYVLNDLDIHTVNNLGVSAPFYEAPHARATQFVVSGSVVGLSALSFVQQYATASDDSLNFHTELTAIQGHGAPWFTDDRHHTGSIISSVIPTGSDPPVGWITGDSNDYDTRGTQIGPESIRPVYPLLDDVNVEKIFDVPDSLDPPTPNQLPIGHRRLIGFRPGLRGTEVNGKWQLLIGNSWSGLSGSLPRRLSSATPPILGARLDGFWFRQFRLEFLLDEGEGLAFPVLGHAMAYKKTGHVPRFPKRHVQTILSGAAGWDQGVNQIFLSTPDQHGRTIGITDQLGPPRTRDITIGDFDSYLAADHLWTFASGTFSSLNLRGNLRVQGTDSSDGVWLITSITGSTKVMTETGPTTDESPFTASLPRILVTVEEIGSAPLVEDFAVFTQITGALADILNLPGNERTRQGYLGNEFRTPHIPLSVGSGDPVSPEFTQIDGSDPRAIGAILNPQPLLDQTNTLAALTGRNSSRTTADLAAEAVLSASL